jgi:hypothetical protein
MKSCMTSSLAFIAIATLFTSIALAQQAAPAAAQQPGPQQPAAPALTPNPEWTHQKLGVFVYPAKGQKPEKQKKDETECYEWARSQTGIDPTGPPTVAEVAPASGGNPGEGARVAGAAKGAAGGAVIGAVAGDAGKGAAIGATAGVMAGGAKKRRAKKAAAQQQQQAEQNGQQQAAAIDQQKLDTFKKAYSACVQGRGYTAQ